MSDTAANTSSMLQDVRARRRTEVRYLNGYVAAKGAEHGIACPWNREMCRRVEELLP
jgi:2-dehydropantoate 2-reductase